MSSIELAIVVPVYNESECIEKVIRSCQQILNSISGHIIAVNDGSTDLSRSIIERMAATDPRILLVNIENQGHGRAIRIGYETALDIGAKFIFQIDSDFQVQLSDFRTIWALKDTTSMICGIRNHRKDGVIRWLITKLLSWFLYLLFFKKIRDANSPFRIMKSNFLNQALNQIPKNVFAPNIFLSLLAATPPESRTEIPVQHFSRLMGRSHLNFVKLLKACLVCLCEITIFRIQTIAQSKLGT